MGMIDVEEIARDLDAFLRRSFQIPANDPGFTHQANLWEEGYVDSVGVVETVAHIENRWQIVLPEHVVFDPAFTNVAGIAALVWTVLGRGGA